MKDIKQYIFESKNKVVFDKKCGYRLQSIRKFINMLPKKSNKYTGKVSHFATWEEGINDDDLFNILNNSENIYVPKSDKDFIEIVQCYIYYVLYTVEETSFSLNWIDVSNVKSFDKLFEFHVKETLDYIEIDCSKWDTSNVRSMNETFTYKDYINDVSIKGIENWNTSNVRTMIRAFQHSKFDLDVSKWDTHNVYDMRGLFSNVKEFNSDISKWDTSGVTTMAYMFMDAEKFNSDISNWDVSNVENMDRIFRGAEKGVKVDVSKWNLDSLTNISNAFDYCEAVLDLSNWNFEDATGHDKAFYRCNKKTKDSYWENNN